MSKLQKNRSKNSSVIETRLTVRFAVYSGPAKGFPAGDRSVALATVDHTEFMVAPRPDSFAPELPLSVASAW